MTSQQTVLERYIFAEEWKHGVCAGLLLALALVAAAVLAML